MSKSIQLKNNDNEKMYPHPYYPVGRIYLIVNDTNPSKWFGGTWEQIAKGRTLVGVDTSQTEFNTVKKIGGSKYLAKHSHYGIFGTNGVERMGGWGTGTKHTGILNEMTDNAWEQLHTGETGTGTSGNLQPYFTCYIWCRTA